MSTVRPWVGAGAIALFVVAFQREAIADSKSGGFAPLQLPTPGPAAPIIDDFNYVPGILLGVLTGSGFPPRPPTSKWAWAANGSSSTFVTTMPGHGEVLAATYGGSGSYELTRLDVASSNASYQIEFYDDGSLNLGEILYAQASDGAWAGIGVNNNVAPNDYYFRTSSTAGNTGTVIHAPRNGAAGNGNWHVLKFALVPHIGIHILVDGVSSPYFSAVRDVQSLTLIGNWSKPKHTVYLDNLQVTPRGTLSPGTLLSGPNDINNPNAGSSSGRLYHPLGSDRLTTLTASDIETLLSSNQQAWANANPERANVVRTAVREANLGLCGGAARSRYNASGEWCSEFARWTLLQSPGVNNYAYCVSGQLDWGECTSGWFAMSDVTATLNLVYVYRGQWRGFTERADVTPQTPQPGDYVSIISGSTGKHFGHSAIVVGISADARYLFTVEGNVDDCAMFGYRDFFVNGVLSPSIDGFGNTDSLIVVPQNPASYPISL